MMRILLYEVGGIREEYNEPLGLSILASSLMAQFNDDISKVEIITRWYFEDETLPDKMMLSSFDIISFSLQIGSLLRFDNIYFEYKNIKRNKPILVVGNVIPTFTYRDFLTKYPDAICVRGEGETAFSKICELVYENRNLTDSLSKIPNIAFIHNEKIHVSDTKTIDLSSYPHINRNFLEFIKKSGGIARVEASRGCHWGNCNFCCVKGKYGESTWRPVPIAQIIDQLETIGKYGILSPYLTDEDFFGGNYDRGAKIAESIIAAKSENRIPKQMNFFLSVMADDIRNNNGLYALSKLKEAGLREIFIGIESGAKKQLKRLGKKANIDTNKIALQRSKNLEFQTDIGFILFDPLMSFQELLANIAYIDNLSLNKYDSRSLKSLRIQPLTPFEKSYSSVIDGQLNIDDVAYPYHFLDNKVSIVHKNYEEWEHEFQNEVYLLQAHSRGEVNSEDNRIYFKEILKKIRDIDFSALKLIISVATENRSKKFFKEELEKYRSSKLNIISGFFETQITIY